MQELQNARPESGRKDRDSLRTGGPVGKGSGSDPEVKRRDRHRCLRTAAAATARRDEAHWISPGALGPPSCLRADRRATSCPPPLPSPASRSLLVTVSPALRPLLRPHLSPPPPALLYGASSCLLRSWNIPPKELLLQRLSLRPPHAQLHRHRAPARFCGVFPALVLDKHLLVLHSSGAFPHLQQASPLRPCTTPHTLPSPPPHAGSLRSLCLCDGAPCAWTVACPHASGPGYHCCPGDNSLNVPPLSTQAALPPQAVTELRAPQCLPTASPSRPGGPQGPAQCLLCPCVRDA